MVTPSIRLIEPTDNLVIARIIRAALEEHGVNKPGTAYFDESTDAMFESYTVAGACYFVAEIDGELVGGAGIFPTQGLPEGYAELVKMYISAAFRGRGISTYLLRACELAARQMGYHSLYLETLPELAQAVGVYEHLGYSHLPSSLGDSGHFSCTLWMHKRIR